MFAKQWWAQILLCWREKQLLVGYRLFFNVWSTQSVTRFESLNLRLHVEFFRCHSIKFRFRLLDLSQRRHAQFGFLLSFLLFFALFTFDFTTMLCLPAKCLFLLWVVKAASLDVSKQRKCIVEAISALSHLPLYFRAHSCTKSIRFSWWLLAYMAISPRTECW